MRAHYDLDARVRRARPLEGDHRRARIVHREHQDRCVVDVGLLEQLHVRGVPVQRGDPALTEPLDEPPVQVDHDVAESAAVERAGDE